MSFIEIKNHLSALPVNIYFNEYGKGQPVILIHGWPLNSDMWEYQVEALVKSGFRVLTYDRRGFGRSSQPWGGYDYNTLTDDLAMVMDFLRLREVMLVGFSMGGGEVVRYFSRYAGQQVKKAVLIGSVTPLLQKSADFAEGVPQEVFSQISTSLRSDRIGFLDEFGKKFFGIGKGNKVSDPLLQYYRDMGAIASPVATLACADSFATTDFRTELETIQVPTLIIHGDADEIVPEPGTSAIAAKMIKDCTYLRYEGAPHGLFYTHKDRLNTDLIDFMKRP
jgi:pimeloyl-ACP methyl ester carboxylesterase